MIYKVTSKFGEVLYGTGLMEPRPEDAERGVKHVLQVPYIRGFENTYKELDLFGEETIEKMGQDGIIVWKLMDRLDCGFLHWYYNARDAFSALSNISTYYGVRFAHEIDLYIEAAVITETPDNCQDVKVNGESIGYQFASKRHSQRTFKRKVTDLCYDDNGDGPYIMGKARVLKRNVLVVRDDSVMPWLGVIDS